MKIRVVLIDDHKLLRDALSAMLHKEGDIAVVGEADNGRAGLKIVRQLQPDIVVLDIAMKELNGIETAARIKAQFPGVKIVVLSGYWDRSYVLEMLKVGAAGYVIKAAAGSELVRAIRAVSAGRKYLCPEVTGLMVETAFAGNGSVGESGIKLGHREREVLQLLAEGLRSAEIAGRMVIAESTVETHRRNIMRKLDLHSVADLTKYAIRSGLVQL